MQNMTTRNAICIGKAMGSVLEVENCDTKGIICRQYLRVKEELNTSLPLIPGFHIPRNGKESIVVSFEYERLADYCTLCGLIGHKRFSCPSPPQPVQLVNYDTSLRANFNSSTGNKNVFSKSIRFRLRSLNGQPRSDRVYSSTDGGHARESNHLQLVSNCSQSQISEHVAAPPLVVDNYIAQGNASLHSPTHLPTISSLLWGRWVPRGYHAERKMLRGKMGGRMYCSISRTSIYINIW